MKSRIAASLMMAALMFGSALASGMLKPSKKVADSLSLMNLEQVIPNQFGDWTVDKNAPSVPVSPDVQAELDKIYNQTLSRVYTNSRGERVMLSIAYGGDQSDSLTVHMPEGCYKGQGFQIKSKRSEAIHIDGGQIPVVRLLAEKGGRSEPITYWIYIGHDFATSRFERKLAQLKMSLLGKIPEGILVRVSNISREMEPSFTLHQEFIKAMVQSISTSERRRIIG